MIPVNSLPALAWRSLSAHPLRSTMTALAIGLAIAMTLAAEFASNALLETLSNAGEGDLQVTHGFVVEQFDLLLGLVGYALAGTAAFLVFNSFAIAVTQRRQQIGLLRSLGMSARQGLGLVLLEALLLGGGGALLGLILGPLLGRGIVALMKRLGGEILAFGAGAVAPTTMGLALLLGAAVTAVSAWLPARQAARIPPLAALRRAEASLPRRPAPAPALAGSTLSLLLFGWLALAPPGEWLVAPWNTAMAVLLVLLWLGSLGLLLSSLPALAGRLVRGGAGTAGAGRRLLGDNVRRAQGRVLLTLLALAVGPAAITGLTGFMTFAFDDLLGDSINRMAAEGSWAVFPFDLEAGIGGLAQLDTLMLPPAAMDAVIETVGNCGTIAAYRFALIPELSFLGRNYFTYVLDPQTVAHNPSVFRFSEGDRAHAATLMEAGCAALVTPGVAQRLGARVGEEVRITTPAGPLPCTIAGIGVGYGNASIVSSTVAGEVGATPAVGLAITPRPEADVAALQANLDALEAGDLGLYVTSMTDFAELTEELVALMGAALNGLLLLAVLAAALGVVNTTVISLAEREQELALLRAVGATRAQLRRLVLGENALVGFLGGLVGLAAGLGSVVIIVTTFGGNSWGVPDLALWPAAGRALQPALRNGLVGLILTPLAGMLVTAPLLRNLLRRL